LQELFSVRVVIFYFLFSFPFFIGIAKLCLFPEKNNLQEQNDEVVNDNYALGEYFLYFRRFGEVSIPAGGTQMTQI
jgi:hypothetical protein